MRTIHRLIEADKTRKENGEAGFSLIELIIVVVILGILAAIAIPIFLNIQGQAKQNSLATITANAASQAASALAQNSAGATLPTEGDNTASFFANLAEDSNLKDLTLSVSKSGSDELGTDNFCITGKADGLDPATSGPGCDTADSTTAPE